MRRFAAATAVAALLLQSSLASATPFINEFHYDNDGADVGEFIELAGGAGFDLSGWTLQLYNGNPTQLNRYSTINLSGTFTNQSNGWGFLSFAAPGLQNGGGSNSPTAATEGDGIALVDGGGNLVQFLSYEGRFTPNAGQGPASGVQSGFVGSAAFQASTTPVGFSVRLAGTQTAGTVGGAFGSQANGFTWEAPATATPGALNTGQVFTQAPPPPPPPAGVTDRVISQIQGSGHRSPEEGNRVRTTGVVTQLASNGYYLQSTAADNDGNASTSEGVFVFTNSAPTVAVGDLLRVTGTVSEFLPGGAATNLTITQLTGTTFTRLSTGNAVTATVIGAGGRTPPVRAIETSPNLADYDPVNAGRDFYESLEGMVVTVRDARAVAPTVFIGGNRELWVRSDAPTNSLSARGTLVIGPDGPPNVQRGDFNPERIQIDPAGGVNALAQPGDRLGNVTGAVGYAFGNFEIIPTTTPSVIEAAALPREVAAFRAGRSRFTYASYNVENLQTGQAGRFGELALQVRDRLLSPDVIGLQEIVTDGGNNPAATLAALADAIRAAGGGDYGFAFLPPAGAQDDRIVSAYLYNRARVGLVPGSLSYVPGTDAESSAYNNARGPLVAQFTFNGQTITTINNHWTSRGGSQPLFGLNQPPLNAADDRRLGQGQELRAFIDALLASDRRAKVVVNGDLNSFYWEDPQLALAGAGADQVLFGLHELLALNERYSFIFDGNGQLLDYIYASRNLFRRSPLFDIVHFNSEYLDGFSDHDPLIASFLVPAPAAAGLLFLGVAGLVARRRRARAA